MGSPPHTLKQRGGEGRKRNRLDFSGFVFTCEIISVNSTSRRSSPPQEHRPFVDHGAFPLLHGVLNGSASLAQGLSCWFEAVGFQARDQARAAAERCVDCLAALFGHETNIKSKSYSVVDDAPHSASRLMALIQ